MGHLEWLLVVINDYTHDGPDPRKNVAVAAAAFDSLLSSIVGRETTGSPYVPPVAAAATPLGPVQGPPHPRDTARQRGRELVKKYKKAGEGVGRSGGGGEKYKKADAELIREANKFPKNNALRDALKIEGQRLINYGKAVSHK